MHAESAGPGTVISPSISPSSPESEGQSGSITTTMASAAIAVAPTYLSDDPIPPPSPFDQPSTSQGFPIVKVRTLQCSLVIHLIIIAF